MSKLLRWWTAFWRSVRITHARRRLWGEEARVVGKSVSLELSPSEAWDIIALRRSPGWTVLSENLLGLLGDVQERTIASRTKEELDFWRGVVYGVRKSRGLVQELINISEDEQTLIEVAQTAGAETADQ